MTQHELNNGVRVVHEYNMDTLGAPFQVTLIDCVAVCVDPETGEEYVDVPDVVGLINAVVRSRVEHPRKLNGREIAFVRKALGVRAKLLAEFLGMSPEHLSRCEAESKAMSASSEKVLRLFAFLGTFSKDPTEMLTQCCDVSKLQETMNKTPSQKVQKLLDGFLRVFLGMRIQVMFDPTDHLYFRFVRRTGEVNHSGPDDDGEWSDELAVAA
jgi:DNA-binding transcriptional regulator YiaG